MKRPKKDIYREIAEVRNKKDAESIKQPVKMAQLKGNSEPQKAPSLPEITENDLNFSKSLQSKYKKIPFDPLCQLIRELRHDLKRYPEDFNAGMFSMDLNFWNKLCGLEQLKSVKAKHNKIKESFTKEFSNYLDYILFMKTWRFFNNIDLGPDQKKIATGMIFQYFSLFGFTTQEKWRSDGSYQYYPQYLKDRVKSMLKSLSP
jgi:hypothetical protein